MDAFEKLYQKTLRFLTFRPRSEKEIRDYLKKKSSLAKASGGQESNELEAVINSIIKKLKEQNFINDEEFTKWWIEQRTKIKPRAEKIIKFELLQKGIDKVLVEDILKSSNISEFDKAKDLVLRKIKRYEKLDRNKQYEKMSRFLASKGFDWDTIKEVIDQVLIK